MHQTFPIEQLCSLILRHEPFELLHVNERWCNFIYEFDEFLRERIHHRFFPFSPA